MSNQDGPFNAPGSPPAGGRSNEIRDLQDAGNTVRNDLQSAFETVKGDLRAAADTAKSDFSSLKDEAVNQFQDLKGQAGGQVQSLKDQATGNIQSLTSQAQGQLNDASAKAKSFAANQVSQLTDQARSFATEQKDFAAQQFSGVVDAVARVADELQGSQNGSAVAGYAQDIAGSLRNLADTVQNKNVDELFGLVQDFGKRQPLAFLGIAALAGFAVSRFLVASRDKAALRPLQTRVNPYTTVDPVPSGTELEVDRASTYRTPMGMGDNGRI